MTDWPTQHKIEWTDNPNDPCSYCVHWEETDDPYDPIPYARPGVVANQMYKRVHPECEESVALYIEEAGK